ncbi:GGDEF domain-containing protein [Phormidium tenue FACHB-886]|nr:GGDEF domain-containing protein [Phormidium tenue FACHB-886]
MLPATQDSAALEAELARLNAEVARLTELAYKDALTGVANRRMFDERLNEEWSRGSRTESPLSLLLIDIDHFKKYNDTHGHQGGDDLLQGLGALWAAIEIRSFDLLARYGGEEFAVVLPDTSVHGALRVAERIRQAAYAKGVTVSIGVATTVPSWKTEAALLVEQADKALYWSKAAGRDRATVYETELAAA